MATQTEITKKNSFLKKKEEIIPSKRWAEIKTEISKDDVLQKESTFKKYRQPERETFFMRTTKKKTRPPPQFNLETMQKDFPALKKSEK